jgi:Regulator of chromosome condensation (RCC1) repeat
VTALKHVNIGQVAAGFFHSLCLNLTGSQVYSFGRSDYGQLGLGDKVTGLGESVSTPTLVKFPALDGPKVHLFTDIACGDYNSMGLVRKDLTVPKKLEINDSLQKREPNSTAVVHKIGSGGQHSVVLVKRYASSN